MYYAFAACMDSPRDSCTCFIHLAPCGPMAEGQVIHCKACMPKMQPYYSGNQHVMHLCFAKRHGCTCSNVPRRVGCTELPALCTRVGTLCSRHCHAREQPALCTGHRLPCALLAGSFCWWRLAGPSPAQRVPLMLQGGLPGPQASDLKAGRLAGVFAVHKLGFVPCIVALFTLLWDGIYTCSHGK